MSLQALLGEILKNSFFSQFFERQPYLNTSKSAAHWKSIFSLTEVDRILTSSHTRFPGVRMYADGAQVPTNRFTKRWKYGNEEFQDVVDVAAVARLLRDERATLILQDLSRRYRAIHESCVNIGNELNAQVHANAYFTPASSDAIPPHFDTVDVFIIQLEGEKNWCIWQPVSELPTNATPGVNPAAQAHAFDHSPILQTTLREGDVIYIPRGFVHQASTSGGASSLHITLGIEYLRVITAIRSIINEELQELAKESLELRKSVALAFDDNTEAQKTLSISEISEEVLMRTLNKAVSNITDQRIISEVRRWRTSRTHYPSYGKLQRIFTPERLRENSELLVTLREPYRIVRDHRKRCVRLEWGNRRIEVPLSMEKSMTAIFLLPRQLLAEIPGSPRRPVYRLVRKLMEEGVVELAQRYEYI